MRGGFEFTLDDDVAALILPTASDSSLFQFATGTTAPSLVDGGGEPLDGSSSSVLGSNSRVGPEVVWNVHSSRDLDSALMSKPGFAFLRANVLSATGRHLTMMPPELGRLECLRRVELSMNELRALPPSFSQLLNVEVLNLNTNSFSEFPASILALTRLMSLNMGCNPGLRTLPHGISALGKLEMLFVSTCGLVSIPSSIGALTRLSQLHLHDNRFARLPSSICRMDKLQALYLNGNRLRSLPADLGKMTSLRMLFLQNNNISMLPFSVEHMQALWFLDISSNPVPALTPALKKMQVSTFVHKGCPCVDEHGDLVYSLADVSVSAPTLAADILQILHSPDCYDDLDVYCADSLVLTAHMALVHARRRRIQDERLFVERGGPVRDASSGRWRWTAAPDITPPLLRAIFEFLYSGAFEILDRYEGTRDFVLLEEPSIALDESCDLDLRMELQLEADMSSDMARLFQGDDDDTAAFSDLTLCVEGRDFRVHKFVLSRCPPLFVMVHSSFSEAQMEKVLLPMEESAEVFELVLRFIYTDAAPGLNGDNVQDVVASATRWQLPRLLELCEVLIVEGLDAEIALDVLQMCNVFPLSQLKNACVDFIKRDPNLLQRAGAALFFGQDVGTDGTLFVQPALVVGSLAEDPEVETLAAKSARPQEHVFVHPLIAQLLVKCRVGPPLWWDAKGFDPSSVAQDLMQELSEDDLFLALSKMCRSAGFAGAPRSLSQKGVTLARVAATLKRLVPALSCNRAVLSSLNIEAAPSRRIPNIRSILDAIPGVFLMDHVNTRQTLVDFGLSADQLATFFKRVSVAVSPDLFPSKWIHELSLDSIQERVVQMCAPDSYMQRFERPVFLDPLPYAAMCFSVTGSNGSIKPTASENFLHKSIMHMRLWSLENEQFTVNDLLSESLWERELDREPDLAAGWDIFEDAELSAAVVGLRNVQWNTQERRSNKGHVCNLYTRFMALVDWTAEAEDPTAVLEGDDLMSESSPFSFDSTSWSSPGNTYDISSSSSSSNNNNNNAFTFESPTFAPDTPFSFQSVASSKSSHVRDRKLARGGHSSSQQTSATGSPLGNGGRKLKNRK